MTTDKGNKLIAEFMGIKTVIEECEFCGQNVNQVPLCKGDKQGNKRTHALGGILVDLKYHSSWSWLMPVIEKIGNLSDIKVITVLRSRGFTILDDDYEERGFYFRSYDGETNIEKTWNTIIQFIQWYNQNTKP